MPTTGLVADTPRKTCELDIRPQIVKLTENGVKACIRRDLSSVETVGSTSTLHMDFQGREIYALHPNPLHLETGASISFALDPKKFYVYDPEAGDLIAAGDKIPSFS